LFGLSRSLRFFLYRPPADMRKGFDGLCGLVRNELGQEPTNGTVFVFVNRTRDRIKLLHWEPGGYVLYYKRLETGRLSLPKSEQGSGPMSWGHLALVVEGISFEKTKQKRRYLST
jgi:transposase